MELLRRAGYDNNYATAWQFYTGMRLSETFGLLWKDIDLERERATINNSRSMDAIGATKIKQSERTIEIDRALIDILKLLPTKGVGIDYVIVGKLGGALLEKTTQRA